MKKWNNEFKNGILFATWDACSYCKIVEPAIEKISKTVTITELRTERDGWPAWYGVELVPSLMLVENGTVIDKIEGILSVEDVENFVKKVSDEPN